MITFNGRDKETLQPLNIINELGSYCLVEYLYTGERTFKHKDDVIKDQGVSFEEIIDAAKKKILDN